MTAEGADHPVHFSERMMPAEAHARTFWEHVARYRFARQFVSGRRVLDVACGEGYGASGLARAGASHVIGVDLSPETCEHAHRRYGLDTLVGNAQAIPLPDRTVDVVVSFETIEHVDDPSAFLQECTRVLDPPGLLVVSTPNRPVYRADGPKNPFHHIEMEEFEFLDQLQARFNQVDLFSQFPRSSAWWSPRSLASERSPWLHIKGYWRLASWFCPSIRTDLAPGLRDRADDLILGSDRLSGSLFNPYLVRRRSPASREEPYILIAVARGVKPL